MSEPSVTAPIAEAPPPRRLGRYEVLSELGRGGMASVHLARAVGPAGFQKWLAIKRVHPSLTADASFVRMFLDEARIAAAIHHPNVAQVFDLGEADGEYFLAMEYLHGEPLDAVVQRANEIERPIEPELAAYLIARVAEGLHHAHEAKDADGTPLALVHRDVSPQNVFVSYDGHVKLTDFGVAKAAGRIGTTETGVVKGKLAYASPEQLQGEPLDRRSDVFALGVVLWECATGRRLFKGQSDAETLHRIYSGYRLSPSRVCPGFPAELERILDKALAQNPGDRYADAASFAVELDRFVAPSGTGSSQLAARMRELFEARIRTKDAQLREASQPRQSIPAPRSRSRAPIAIASALIAVGLAATGWWWIDRGDPPAQPTIRAPAPPAPAPSAPRAEVEPEPASLPVDPPPAPAVPHRPAHRAPPPELPQPPAQQPPSTHRAGDLSQDEFFP